MTVRIQGQPKTNIKIKISILWEQLRKKYTEKEKMIYYIEIISCKQVKSVASLANATCLRGGPINRHPIAPVGKIC